MWRAAASGFSLNLPIICPGVKPSCMTPFDIAVLIVVGLSALFALSRGLVTELLSLLAWVGAFIGTRLLFSPVSAWARTHIESPAFADITALLLLFFGLLMLLRFIANFAGSKVKQTQLSIVDRSMGAAFGAVRGLLIVSLFYAAWMLLVPRADMPDWVQTSKAEPLVAFGADTVTSAISTMRRNKNTPQDAEQMLPEDGNFDGYPREDRQQLDREIERGIKESAKQHGETAI
jgi:uncharacterized membrane protein required for colicin V production